MKTRFYPEKIINVCKCKPGAKEHKPSCYYSEAILYLYVRTGKTVAGVRNTIKISVGEKIPLKNWNDEKRELRANVAGRSRIEDRMAEMEGHAKDVYNELSKKYKPIPFDILKNAIEGRIKNTVQDTQRDFFNVMDEFIAGKEKANRATATVNKYSALREHLVTFKTKYPRVTVSFDTVNESFLSKLKDFFVEDEKQSNSTVEKYFRMLKTVLQYAVEKNYSTNKYFKEFKLDLDSYSKEIIFLEMDELMHLYHFDLSNHPSYEKARDIFAFQCFTGQRISDIQRITKDDIKTKKVAGEEQHTWEVRTKKTKGLIHLPLNEFALEILDKYKKKKLDTPLPKLAEQNINIYLKEICKDAELTRKVKLTRLYANEEVVEHLPLWEFASTHMARRTFITLSLEQGIPVETIMRYTGHKSYKSMGPYLAITEKRSRTEMRAWSRDRIPTMQVVS